MYWKSQAKQLSSHHQITDAPAFVSINYLDKVSMLVSKTNSSRCAQDSPSSCPLKDIIYVIIPILSCSTTFILLYWITPINIQTFITKNLTTLSSSYCLIFLLPITIKHFTRKGSHPYWSHSLTSLLLVNPCKPLFYSHCSAKTALVKVINHLMLLNPMLFLSSSDFSLSSIKCNGLFPNSWNTFLSLFAPMTPHSPFSPIALCDLSQFLLLAQLLLCYLISKCWNTWSLVTNLSFFSISILCP